MLFLDYQSQAFSEHALVRFSSIVFRIFAVLPPFILSPQSVNLFISYRFLSLCPYFFCCHVTHTRSRISCTHYSSRWALLMMKIDFFIYWPRALHFQAAIAEECTAIAAVFFCVYVHGNRTMFCLSVQRAR